MESGDVCNLCGDSLQARAFGDKPESVVRCQGCGLVRISPMPTAEELREFYRASLGSPASYYAQSVGADRKSFRWLFRWLERHPVKPGGDLLDLGSGPGTFLEQARDAPGWRARGVEISPDAVRRARERGLETVEGPIEGHDLGEDAWDWVFLGDVIEHLLDPSGILERILRALRPGGHLLVSTPAIESWAARTFQIKPREHLYYFSKKTLDRMLREAGFEVVSLVRYDRYRNLSALYLSSTFAGGVPTAFSWVVQLLKVLPAEMNVRLPLGENLLALARKPEL